MAMGLSSLSLRLGGHQGAAGAAPALSVTEDDIEMSFDNLGGDAFSVTITGSSVAAKNGTYTTDSQGRTLTGALLLSEWTLCLLQPTITLSIDVDSDTEADAGDTASMGANGLWIYDPDQGVPPARDYQWRLDAVAVSGETDPDGYVFLGGNDSKVLTMTETLGGNTVVSSNSITQAVGIVRTPVFSDNFDRANENLEVSASWDKLSGTPTIIIVNNQIRSDQQFVDQKVTYNVVSTEGYSQTDQYVSVTFNSFNVLNDGASFNLGGALLRGAASAGYEVRIRTFQNVATLQIFDRSTSTVLSSKTVTTMPTTMIAEIQGSDIRVYFDGVEFHTYTPASPPASGLAGVVLGGNYGGFGPNAVRADDFVCGDVT